MAVSVPLTAACNWRGEEGRTGTPAAEGTINLKGPAGKTVRGRGIERGENCSGEEEEEYICKSDERKGEASAVNREERK